MNRNVILLLLPVMLHSSVLAHVKNSRDEFIADAFPAKVKITMHQALISESPEYAGPGMDTIPYPWSEVDIISAEAKVLNIVPVVEDGAFPWIPVIGGVVVVGTVIYFLTREDEDDPVDCSFTASAQSISSSCGQSNGSISIQVNPSGDYSYVWSNGSTGSMISDVLAGSYTVTITKLGTSCSEVVSSTVTNQNPFFDATISSQDADCDQQNGTVSVTPSPPGAYTYLWSNGATTQNQSGLVAGSYTVTISAGGTCEKYFSTQIGTVPFEPNISITTTPSTCGGADGTASITVDPPDTYAFTWSNGQVGAQVSGLTEGSYTVTVSKPGTTCTHDASVTIDELPASFTIVVTPTNAGCGLSDGMATAVVDPPGDYTYTWSNGQSGSQLSGVAAGDYTVTVTVSGSDCSKEASVTIGSDPFPYSFSYSTTPSHCGATDGSVSVLITPQGEFGYQWSNGGNGAELTGLGAGSYSVTVTDVVTSCAETFTVTVDEVPAEITLSFTTTPAGCGISNGSATVMADPPAAYTYLWSNGNTTPQLSGVLSGTYSVTVTIMGTACSAASSVDVEQAGGGFTATFTTENADCGFANGSATTTVDPSGEYTYQWSNQQSGSTLQQVVAGTYTLTVTDMNACTEEFSVTIVEDPPAYITLSNTVPGTCIGGGEISFVLESSAGGPIHGDVTGPSGNVSFSYSPGFYQLSAIATIVPGAYSFTVYDESIGTTCQQTVMVTVEDSTPALVVNDDFYTTPAGQALTQNALDNDSGLNIQMTNVSDEFGGTVNFGADGTFTFIPDPGFNGEASFTYTVQDACGNISTGIVTIIVEQAICDFNVEFETTPASCGLEDGAITVNVIEPGTYMYVWSNGDSGPSINAIAAGTYSVTITDINLGCDLMFSIDLPENPAEYIEDIFITQPACGVEGEIRFTVNTNSGNQLILTITHPNGSDQFFVDPGVIFLSDYISVTPGDYLIEVTDEGASGDCIESFETTLIAAPMLEIIAEAVIPPSEPTAMDGLVIIVVIVPGTLPYEILLDGNSWGVAFDNTFQVGGLGVGNYTIQIIDAMGCVSNILTILVPPPPIIMSFGTSVMQTVTNESNDEPVTLEPATLWRSMLTSSVGYYIGKVRQEVMARYAVPVAGHPGFAEVSYMTDIGRYTLKGIGFALQGGMGSHFEKQEGGPAHTLAQPNYLVLRASGGYTIAKRFRMQGNVEVRGWDSIEKPQIEIGLSIPFSRSTLRWGN